MNRRQFLRASALGVAFVAGCGSGGDGGDEDAPRPPTNDGQGGDGGGQDSIDVDLGTLGPAGSDLEVTEFDYGPGENDHLTVTVGAKNTDDEATTVVLVQSVSVDGTRYEKRKTLEFAAGEDHVVTVTYDVTMDEFEDASTTGINGPEWEWPEDAGSDGS